MGAIFDRLAVQSYCYRGTKPLPDLLERVKKTGLSRLELCAVHVDFNDESTFDQAISTCQDAGIELVQIGVETFTGDVAHARKRFEFARKAGIKLISCHFVPDSFDEAHPMVTKLCDEYDIDVAIHNHGGYHWLGNMEMLSYVFSQVSPRIGLCLDTAWALDARHNPVKMAEKFIDRLKSTHIKDFTFKPDRMGVDTIVGEGNLDLPGLLKLLNDHHFTGPAILEYEGDIDNPVPALQKCVEAVKQADS